MNIHTEKLGLIEWITKLNDISVIKKLQKIHDEYTKFSGRMDDLTIEQKESIDRGLKDIEDGRVHLHDSVREVYEKYL